MAVKYGTEWQQAYAPYPELAQVLAGVTWPEVIRDVNEPLPGLFAKVGSFASPPSASSLAVTGVGFQPKVIFLWAQEKSSDGVTTNGAVNTAMPLSFGGGIDSTHHACMYSSDDFSGGNPGLNETHIVFLSEHGSTKVSATLTSLDTDGFTLNFDVAAVSGMVVNYLALGGTDITNVGMLSIDSPAGTGSQAYTGLGFKPDAVILVGGTPLAGGVNDAFVGWASDTSHTYALSSSYSSGAAAVLANNRVLETVRGTTVESAATLTSFDADGLTLNWGTIVGAAGADKVRAFCIKGIQVKAGNISKKASTGTQAYTGVGFRPKALLMMSAARVASNTPGGTDVAWMFGGTDGNRRGSVAVRDNANGNASLSRTKVLSWPLDGSASARWEADIFSIDADGFTLNYTTSDATADDISYLAFGPAVAGGGGGPSSYSRALTDTLSSVVDTAVRQLLATRTSADTIAAMSDTPARLVTRPLTDTLSAVSDTPPQRAVVRTLADTLSAVTDATPVRAVQRFIADTLSSVSDATPLRLFARSLADTLSSVSDAPPVRQVTRKLADTASAVSDTPPVRTVVRLLTDVLSSVSDAAPVRTTPRALADTLSAVTDSTPVRAVARNLSDAVSAVSDSAPVRNVTRPVTDTLSAVSDALARKLAAFRTAGDTLGGGSSDTAVVSGAGVKAMSDTLGGASADTVTRQASFGRAAADAIAAVSDALARLAALGRSLADTVVAMGDTTSRQATRPRQAADTLTAMGDTTTRLRVSTRTLSDPLVTFSDTVAPRRTLTRTVADVLAAMSDLVSTALPFGIVRVSSVQMFPAVTATVAMPTQVTASAAMPGGVSAQVTMLTDVRASAMILPAHTTSEVDTLA